MFGEKARLQESVRQCEQDHGPWIALAQEVAHRALAEEESSELDFGDKVSQVVDAMVAEQRSNMVLRQFEKLPSEIGWQIIADLFDDDELKQILANRRAELDKYVAGREVIETIAAMSRQTGRINVAQAPLHSEVSFRLYDPEEYDDMKERQPRNDPDRTIRAASLGNGSFQVIDDNIRDGVNFDSDKITKPDLSDNPVVRFGMGYVGEELQTKLFRFAPLKCEIDNNLKRLRIKDDGDSYYDQDLVLYDVEIDGVPMFTHPRV